MRYHQFSTAEIDGYLRDYDLAGKREDFWQYRKAMNPGMFQSTRPRGAYSGNIEHLFRSTSNTEHPPFSLQEVMYKSVRS